MSSMQAVELQKSNSDFVFVSFRATINQRGNNIFTYVENSQLRDGTKLVIKIFRRFR